MKGLGNIFPHVEEKETRVAGKKKKNGAADASHFRVERLRPHDGDIDQKKYSDENVLYPLIREIQKNVVRGLRDGKNVDGMNGVRDRRRGKKECAEQRQHARERLFDSGALCALDVMEQ